MSDAGSKAAGSVSTGIVVERNRATTRKRKTKNPCSRCSMHLALCICKQIPQLNLATRLILVVHAKELKRTTNTGRLATEALTNAKVLVRGQGKEALDLSSLLHEGYESVLLYPSEEAVELADFFAARPQGSAPLQILVPDGNWRQASKVSTRHPELAGIPRVKLSAAMPLAAVLRKEHFPNGLSTLQAIAFAFSVIEGPDVGQSLQQLYEAKLHATLRGRGVVGS